MLTMYPVIMPFCSSTGGASHLRRTEREERATAVQLLGGEVGAVHVPKVKIY